MARDSKLAETRRLCEESCYLFAVLVGENRLYGDIHKECFTWLSQPDALDQLLLLPRGHLKSHMIAVWCAWWITKHPETTIMYVSATEDLAINQLSAIKAILESEVYRRYWPEMVHAEEAKRERWAMKDIKVDHPTRKALGVRDSTVAARGIDANTTGLHCDVLLLDDIVSPYNAYSEAGRESVRAGYSQFASVCNPGAITKVVGTRYTGKDIYGMLAAMTLETYDAAKGELVSSKVFQVFERVVETNGTFLWPRTVHPKTKKVYGFDVGELAKIRAKYYAAGERIQFHAQYYNDVDAGKDDSEKLTFTYYNPGKLVFSAGRWWYGDKPLMIFAGGDLAFTTRDTSDYTAFAVVGVDWDGFIYILDLIQLKTSKYDDYYKAIADAQAKWGFTKARIESNAGANVIVEYIKEQFRNDGRAVAVEGARAVGEKVERVEAILMPRYRSNTILHGKGGWFNVYEDQLSSVRPTHDDLRDAVAIAVQISRVPAKAVSHSLSVQTNVVAHPRFGGIRRG